MTRTNESGLPTADMVERHGALRSAVLHLAPGGVALFAYLFLCAPLSVALGLPGKMGFVLMDVLVLIPVLLGLLLYFGRRRNGRWTLDGIVLNRRRLAARELSVVLLALFGWGAIVMLCLSWTEPLLRARLFYWVPVSLLNAEKLDVTGYSPALLIGTRVASIALVGVAGPIAEELYFRGFLLPRVSWMGAWAPAWQAVLFTGYHFLSPWAFVWRVIVLIPAIYAVQRKQSLSIGVWGHCLGNTVGEFLALAAVLQAIGNRGAAL